MNARQQLIAELMLKTGCTAATATSALILRDGILIFAIEYLERRDLAKDLSIKERYPMWCQYVVQKRRI